MLLFWSYFSVGREGGGSTAGGGDGGMVQKELDLHYYTEQAIIAAKTQVSLSIIIFYVLLFNVVYDIHRFC